MSGKVLSVFYDSNCLPYKDKERQVHFPIIGNAFVGASNTTEIVFFTDDIGGNDYTWVAVAKLPNGKLGSKVLTTSYEDDGLGYRCVLSLNSWYTQAKGDVYINLQGYQGDIDLDYDDETELYTIHGTPTIQATGSIKLAINYATQINGGDEIETITLQELLALINTLKDYGMIVFEDMSNEDLSLVDIGRIIYDEETRLFYKKTSSSSPYVEEWNLIEEFKGVDSITFSNTAGFVSSGTNLVFTSPNLQLYTANFTVSASNFSYGGSEVVNTSKLNTELAKKQNNIPVVLISGSTGTISDSTVLNSLNTFPSYLVDSNNDIYIHCETNSTNYVFRKIVDKDFIDNSTELIYGQVWVEVNKTTGVYNVNLETYDIYSKDKLYTKTEVDSIVSTLKANQFQVVESLPAQGQEGIIYLVAISGGTGYTQYIWESGSYIDLGDTSIDLSGYVQTSRTIAGIALTSNISSQALTDALVYMNDTTDLDYVMED